MASKSIIAPIAGAFGWTEANSTRSSTNPHNLHLHLDNRWKVSDTSQNSIAPNMRLERRGPMVIRNRDNTGKRKGMDFSESYSTSDSR